MQIDINVALTRVIAILVLIIGRVIIANIPFLRTCSIPEPVFGGVDVVRAGSTAGSLISRGTAIAGVTIPMRPAAERFFARPAAAAAQQP